MEERADILANKSMKLTLPNFFFTLFISLAGTVYAQIPQIERDALIALYNSTDCRKLTAA
jgi:hypothetical protein